MPNWCSNSLTVQGAKEDVENFINKVSDNKLCIFQAFTPLPEELSNTASPSKSSPEELDQLIKKYGYPDWYSWQISNWGIKWGCNNLHIDRVNLDDESPHKKIFQAILYYDTPWGPGEEFLSETFQGIDKLSFFLYYEEPGMGFEGCLYVKNGSLERNTVNEMSDIPKTIEEAE